MNRKNATTKELQGCIEFIKSHEDEICVILANVGETETEKYKQAEENLYKDLLVSHCVYGMFGSIGETL